MGDDSELVVLDETGSESEGVDTIQVSDHEPTTDHHHFDEEEEGEVIVLDECGVDIDDDDEPPLKRKRRHRKHNRKERPYDEILQHNRELKLQNDDLKQQLAKLRNNHSITIGSENVVRVEFSNEVIYTKFKDSIDSFVSNLLQKYEEETRTLFFVDNKRESPSLSKQNWEIPKYSANYDGILANKTEENENQGESNAKPKSTCFNCLGDHMMNECPVPLDRMAINQNRKEFYSKYGGKQTRYHVELDPRFSKHKAGKVSNELRRALKLEQNQLPPYIYKMRQLGYPPGWLLEAQVVSSGLTMYDTEGRAVIDENLEEGEVSEPGDRQVQYDPAKLVEYPGFNIHPDSAFVDEFRVYGSIPMQPDHMISYVTLRMKPPQAKAFSRKKSTETKVPNQFVEARDEEDMEIEEGASDHIQLNNEKDDKCMFIPPLPKDDLEMQPPPPPPPDPQRPLLHDQLKLCATPSRSTSSPSLEALETAKQSLMLQLERQCGSSQEDDSGVECLSQLNSLESAPDFTTPQTNRVHPLAREDSTTTDSESQDENNSAAKTRSASKKFAFGTPILESVSPYEKIPERDKWAVGITEHLPFANLPDSTGNFEKFRGLLDKIRGKIPI